MELSHDQIETIINNYKHKREREKSYYHRVKKTNEEFVLKNRERAKNHYALNKDKKLIKYRDNKEFLSARQLFHYYKRNDKVATFMEKHPQKYQLLKSKGVAV